MEESKATTTPINPGTNNENETKIEKEGSFPYNQAVGSLQHLSSKTRPDLAYAVNYESRSMKEPTQSNILDVKRTMRYINGTKEYGIQYSSKKSKDVIVIEAYSDSDYAGDKEKRKSTSGLVIMYAGGPVAWRSKRQTVIARSTTEAEFIAAADCATEIKILKFLLKELLDKDVYATLKIDNQSAIKIIKSGQISRKKRHIEVDYHYISHQYEEGMFTLEYCNTDDQVADVFTKALPNVKFTKFRDMLTKKRV
jgi:hypothetical protein